MCEYGPISKSPRYIVKKTQRGEQCVQYITICLKMEVERYMDTQI